MAFLPPVNACRLPPPYVFSFLPGTNLPQTLGLSIPDPLEPGESITHTALQLVKPQ